MLYNVFLWIDNVLLSKHRQALIFLMALNYLVAKGDVDREDLDLYISYGGFSVTEDYGELDGYSVNIDTDLRADYPLVHSLWLNVDCWCRLKKMKNIDGMQTLINSLKKKTNNKAWEVWYNNSTTCGTIVEFPVVQLNFESSIFLCK